MLNCKSPIDGRSIHLKWFLTPKSRDTPAINKPEAKSQSKVQAQNPKRGIGLWAVTKILWAKNPPHPILHVQVEHYQKKSQDYKPKSIIPGLDPVDCESGSHLKSHQTWIINEKQ